jgi:hypothetical protein
MNLVQDLEASGYTITISTNTNSSASDSTHLVDPPQLPVVVDQRRTLVMRDLILLAVEHLDVVHHISLGLLSVELLLPFRQRRLGDLDLHLPGSRLGLQLLLLQLRVVRLLARLDSRSWNLRSGRHVCGPRFNERRVNVPRVRVERVCLYQTFDQFSILDTFPAPQPQTNDGTYRVSL